MEKEPSSEMTIEQINAEIFRLGREIIAIEEGPMPSFESGSNTPDDQTTEVTMALQAQANGPEHEIAERRHRIKELEEQRDRMEKAA
jgi:hypothetical protein